MEKYTLEQRKKIIKTYFANGQSLIKTHRKIRDFFGPNCRPNESTIQRLVKKFRETGSVEDKKRTGRPKSGMSEENIAAVLQSIADDPAASLAQRSRDLGIHSSTVWRILKKEGISTARESKENTNAIEKSLKTTTTITKSKRKSKETVRKLVKKEKKSPAVEEKDPLAEETIISD